jgi:hypothetical protein
MKRGYSKLLYSQRNKDETILSVMKRLFGEHLTSRLVRTQNRELSLRCIAYNMHRLTNLIVTLMFSTQPCIIYVLEKSEMVFDLYKWKTKYPYIEIISQYSVGIS